MHEFFRNHDSVKTATPAPTSRGDEVEVEVELVPFPAATNPRSASSPPVPYHRLSQQRQLEAMAPEGGEGEL